MSKKKINLLIPIAGRAQRFINEGYNMPKPLIMVKERLMIDLAMTSVAWEDCNLIFVVRKDHVYSFAIDQILKQYFGEHIKVVTTDGITCGSVCTCLLAKEHIDNNAPLLIYTPDVFFQNQFNPYEIDPDVDGMLLTFKANSDAHSYVQLNEEGNAIKTAEKVVISQNAAVGVYYFRHGSEFVKKAEQMIDLEMTVNGEYYICPIYNLFIEDDQIIKIKEVEKMHVLGTPEELEFYLKNVAPKFGDKPIGLACDHSGYEAKEQMRAILDDFAIDYIDFGTYVHKACDYTDYTSQAIRAIKNNVCDFAIGFCRTGQRVNITANKQQGIRSVLVFDDYTAEYGVRHNCANFFTIPSKYTGEHAMKSIVKTLLKSSFDGGRHMTRLTKAENIE